ncbi:hypothetical protein BZA70DRAFT_41899 [Myxozyma melibiosi]|uniref:DUF3752 domain-containing protein n=1 Tax=Myxozyma melibiosi TaxID=54550 RepID=A0ABR1FEK4_9ASCO
MSGKAGPSLPPHILAAREAKRKRLAEEKARKETQSTAEESEEVKESESVPKKARVGPAIPKPEELVNASTTSSSADLQVNEESDDSSDDEMGPVLPKDVAQAEEEARRRLARAAESAKKSTLSEVDSSKREEWMLVPPSEKDWARSQADPLQLKNKKFLSGKAASTVGSKNADGSWMETEAERKKRVGEEMMGLRPKAGEEAGGAIGPAKPPAARDAEKEQKVREYNEKNRGKSLVEQYHESMGKGKSVVDDPSKRVFDYEKDIASGGKIMSASRISEMSKRAGDVDSRFSKGKFL